MASPRRRELSVEEAQEEILRCISVLGPERAPVLAALDRVLAEEIVADRDIPPLDNSAMDGFAFRAADLTADGVTRLKVVGGAPAGYAPAHTISAGQSVRIMTGAPIPSGADTVVRFEDTVADEGWVDIVRAPRPGANIRQAGEDVRAGQVVLRPGKVLRPQEIGMLSALGRVEVVVRRRPRVVVLPTGDEVVPPSQVPGPGQIRDANSYTLAAQVLRFGGAARVLDVARDDESALRRALGEGISPVAILRMASRHFQKLHFVVAQMKTGRSLDQSVSRLRPPIIFLRADSFKAQARSWTAEKLARAMALLLEAETDCKSTGIPAEAVCGRALLRITQAAQTKRQYMR